MRYIMVLVFICFLLVTACSKGTITAQPVAELKTVDLELEVNVTDKDDACAVIVCDAGSECVDGACVCKSEFKQCGDECIPESACCSDADCAGSKVCEEGVCIATSCLYNQHYDSSEQQCACDEGAYYCAAQNKCIPKKNCCLHTACGTYERCVPTQFITSICMVREKKICRSVIEGRVEPFFFGKDRFNVEIIDVLQDGLLHISVNDRNLTLELNKEEALLNMTVYMEELELLGGYCKEA